jgi:DNA-binding response OmpR family regulator
MRVLIVEDERRLASIIKQGLIEEGYEVDAGFGGEEAQYIAETTSYDIIILDIILPKKDGIVVYKDLCTKQINAPILMLTGRDNVDDRVKKLDSGAVDYMIKHFAFSELLARIRALLRRETVSKTPEMQVEELVWDTFTREAWRGERKIDLTTKEYSILECFMSHPNMTITRTMLEENAWDYEYDSMSNIVDVYVRKLHHKIDRDGDDSVIRNDRGAGCRLKTT